MALAALLGVGSTLTPAAARAAEPKAAIQGVEDRELRDRIEQAVGEEDRPPRSRFQARRRAADAAETAILALRSEGYYDYDVTPDVTDSEPPRAVVKIVPGPRSRFAGATVEWIATAPDAKTQAAALKAVDLKDGEPGRAPDVVAAEGRVVGELSRRGYADAKAGDRQVVVDHADKTVHPTLRIDAGPLVKLDGVVVDTQGRTNPRWVAALAPWKPGRTYDPDKVAELERRLLDTGVYDSVSVALAPPTKTTPDGRRPVVVSLIDRPKSTLELGAGFSTSEGVGVEALWNRYNRLGRADTFTVTLRMAELEQRLGAQLALPNWGKPARTLTLGSNILQEQTDAYDRAGIDFHADLKQRFGKTSFFTYGGAIEFTRTNEPEFDPRTGETIGVERQLVIVSALAGLSLDRSNDPLDPTHGWRFNGEARPTLVTGDESLGYLRAQGQVTGYWPFGREARTVLAGRLRLGTILGGDIPGVPAPQRFYSGGGGSVRGYDYQGIGPRLPNGAPLGGLSLFETSIELRQQLFGKWGGAVFLDGGSVGEDATPTFSDVRWAGGFGVRYRLPFGPVRADVAFPFDRSGGQSTFQLYISIGQAF